MRIHTSAHRQSQTGISLIVVMVMLLLGTIVVLGSTRVGWLNEKLVGNQSDTQRAFAAAEALVRDAERDIKGLRADGTVCNASFDFVGCRNEVAGQPYFPQQRDDLDILTTRVSGGVSNCLRGICFNDTATSSTAYTTATWTTNLGTMTGSVTVGTGTASIAATYGEYTGAVPATEGNPLLTATPRQAWYWVEVFNFNTAIGLNPIDVVLPDKDNHPFVYRITAFVQGQKPGTQVWLRSIYIPRPDNAR